MKDPALDLAVISAILSSSIDIAIDNKTCFAAEISLTGEIRSVSRIDQRIQEAEKLGFTKIFIAKKNKINSTVKQSIQIIPVSRVEEVFRILFKKN